MALEKDYGYYIENGKIAIVQPNSESTGGDWQDITTAGKTIRIFAERLATDFDTTLTDDNKTVNLPERFRRLIADLVIARGYEMPQSKDLEMHKHFFAKYQARLRDMKKARNANYQKGGTISPWYY